MRPLLALLAVLALLLSGCSGTGEEPSEDAPAPDLDADGVPDTTDDSDGDGTVDADDPTPIPVPETLVFQGELKGVGTSAVVPSDVPIPQCAPTDTQCETHAVTVPAGNWNVTFTLVGEDGMVTGTAGQATGVVGPSGTDYDLFVEGVGDSTNPSGDQDEVNARLKAGTYNAMVVAWHDYDGAYTLTVTFAP